MARQGWDGYRRATEDAPCADCGATVEGNDPVRGVCQAWRRGEPPERRLGGLRLVLTDRDTGEVV